MRAALAALGRVIGARPWAFVATWVLVFLACGVYGADAAKHLSVAPAWDKTSSSWHAYEVLDRDFQGHIPDVLVLYAADNATVDDPGVKTAVTQALGRLPQGVTARVVTGYDAPPTSGMISPDRRAVRVYLSLAQRDFTAMLEDVRRITPLLKAEHPAVTTSYGGSAIMGVDYIDISSKDNLRAELIALPIVFLVSMFIFGSLVAAGLPSLVGLMAVVLASACLRGLTNVTDVAQQAQVIVTILGMGLAVDYTLFVINRFREELGDGRGREASRAAMVKALATSGRTVLVSGVIVTISLAGLLIFQELTPVKSVAYGAIPAVIGAMLAAVTLLPAVLVLLGHRVNSGRLPHWLGGKYTASALAAGTAAEDRGMWARLGHHVMGRPWRYLLGVTVLLVALGLPFLSVRPGAVDEHILPSHAPSRHYLTQEAAHFGGDLTQAYATVEGGTPAQVNAYAAALKAVPGIDAVMPRGTAQHDGRATTWLGLTWHGTPQERASYDRVQALRDVPAPPGATTHIGGTTALATDLLGYMKPRLPWLVLGIGLAMMGLLFVAFRSVLLPLKAVIMSALSLTASYGVITWVFQDGHLSGLLGFTPLGYLEIFTPLVMGVVLFGLSMDYEVFLLSRVREEWDATGNNEAAVVHGLARTGRIITGAALLLGIVIGAVSTSSVVVTKMAGLGMLVGILVDATIIRCLLVPATMKLLGRWNWWAPRWMAPRRPALAHPGIPAEAELPVVSGEETPARSDAHR